MERLKDETESKTRNSQEIRKSLRNNVQFSNQYKIRSKHKQKWSSELSPKKRMNHRDQDHGPRNQLLHPNHPKIMNGQKTKIKNKTSRGPLQRIGEEAPDTLRSHPEPCRSLVQYGRVVVVRIHLVDSHTCSSR